MTRRQRYFIKQKLIGLAVIILGIVSAFILDGDATPCMILIPMGLALVITKDMVWMDSYYHEMEGKKGRRS